MEKNPYIYTIRSEPSYRLELGAGNPLDGPGSHLMTPEAQGLANTLLHVLDTNASDHKAPSEFNGHTISQEHPGKLRIHAPNSDAFIDLMTPEEPDKATSLCKDAMDLLDKSSRTVLINGEPGTVVPHPYLFKASHIEGALPQYAWLAYLGKPTRDRPLLPSIIFTRTNELTPDLETTHGKGQGLGFWEHTSPLNNASNIYLVALGKASTEYQSNAPGDIEDVAEIITGVKAAAEQAKLLRKAARLPYIEDVSSDRVKTTLMPEDRRERLLWSSRKALRALFFAYAGFSVGSAGVMTTLQVISSPIVGLREFGGDIQKTLVYQFEHPFNFDSPLKTTQSAQPDAGHRDIEVKSVTPASYCDTDNVCIPTADITPTSIQPVGALSLRVGTKIEDPPVVRDFQIDDAAANEKVQINNLPDLGPLPTDATTLTAHDTSGLTTNACETIPGAYDGRTELFAQAPLDKGLNFTVVNPTTLKVCRVRAKLPAGNETFYLHRK